MAAWRILTLCAFASFNLAHSVLVGGAVLPHGDFAFDPNILEGVGSPETMAQAKALHEGSVEAANFIAGLNPDVILLTSPHGLQASWDWGFYANSHLKGRAVVGRDTEESYGKGGFAKYNVDLDALGSPDLASELVDGLADAGHNATLLKGWGDAIAEELHWGEVLPLELVRRAGKGKLPPVIVAGLPSSRYNYSSSIAAGVQQMGEQLGHLLAKDQSRRVAMVVSTDLAHRHWANISFGFSPDSDPFEQQMGEWGASLSEQALVGPATLSIVDHIYSCGYLGMVLLHGALSSSGHSWKTHLTGKPSAPIYYGMMASFVEPQASSILV